MDRISLSLAVAAILFLAPVLSAEPQDPAPSEKEVAIAVVKYDQLLAAVKAQHGKIVVVDVWATFCKPCKEEFPKLVDLHQRHAKDGVACMSVSVDEADKRDAALAFLKSKSAAFSNFLLDEEPSVWQEKWNLTGVPAVFVFDRDGSRAAKFDTDDPDKQFTYDDVNKLVDTLLAKGK